MMIGTSQNGGSAAARSADGLTEREREVLALMAEGLTDRGIAGQLVVSKKTVETHVRHILLKLAIPATPRDNRRVQAVLTYLAVRTPSVTKASDGVC